MKTLSQFQQSELKRFDEKFPDLVEVIKGNPFSGVVRNSDVKKYLLSSIEKAYALGYVEGVEEGIDMKHTSKDKIKKYLLKNK